MEDHRERKSTQSSDFLPSTAARSEWSWWWGRCSAGGASTSGSRQCESRQGERRAGPRSKELLRFRIRDERKVVEPHFEPRRKVRKNSCCWPLSHTFWHTVKRKFNICNYVELNLTTVVYVFQWIIRVSITKVNLHLLIRVFRYEVNQVMCFLQNISKSQNKCLEFGDWISAHRCQ